MASQEDDNKLESKSNVNKDQERNFINVYKKFECVLKNKNEPYPKKIQALIEIWRSLGKCNKANSEVKYIIQIMDWAKLHTLNLVLMGKWKKYKAEFESKLLHEVEMTQKALTKIEDMLSKKFQKLADVIRNPWDDPVLENLLHDSSVTIGEKEIEFFCVETAYLISMRLKKLCESQCEDLALNLVTGFMNCYNLSQTQNFSLYATEIHILFCFDLHVALLYKANKMSEIVALFKKLSLTEGLHLIERFAKKRVKIFRVWRNYPDITFLAAQVFVTAAVTKPFDESGIILRKLLTTWIDFSIDHSMVEKLENSVRRIIQAATAAQHIYVCCQIVHNKFGATLKTFTIELYIRALTTDMNNLESQKTENEKEKVDETAKRLANGFDNLADILKDNLQVSRECSLTAFSLDPTLDRLRKIEELASLAGFTVLDTGQMWDCKYHPPATTNDELCSICNACGNWMCKPNLDLRLTTNFALNEALNFEQLGISSQLCDDLAVILNGPRYHLLSWLLKWNDLHRLCEMYLNDMEHTKNLVTDLKFVDIDYSMFISVKREPVDELAGIERGYESFLFTDEKSTNKNETLTTAAEGVTESMTKDTPEFLLPQPKSDPDTLKSLRMFRHNIKRSKPTQVPQDNIIESNNIASSSNSSQNYTNDNWFLDYVPPKDSKLTTPVAFNRETCVNIPSEIPEMSCDAVSFIDRNTLANREDIDEKGLDVTVTLDYENNRDDFKGEYKPKRRKYGIASTHQNRPAPRPSFTMPPKIGSSQQNRTPPFTLPPEVPRRIKQQVVVKSPSALFDPDFGGNEWSWPHIKNIGDNPYNYEKPPATLDPPNGSSFEQISKNQNHFFSNGGSTTDQNHDDVKSYVRRSSTSQEASDKRFKSDDDLKTTTCSSLYDDKNFFNLFEVSPLKENESKNANCCSPTEKIDKARKQLSLDDSSMMRSNSENKSQSADIPKSFDVNTKIIPEMKSLLKAEPKIIITPEDNLAIANFNKNHSKKYQSRKDVDRRSIMDGNRRVSDEKRSISVDEDESSSTEINNEDLFKFESAPKQNSEKELKIILHRLSTEVIHSFVPSHNDRHHCACGSVTNGKSKRMHRKSCRYCKYRSNNTNRSYFKRNKYLINNKYSLRGVRKEDHRNKRYISRNARRDRDLKKSGHKNVRKFDHHRRFDDKPKKPKIHCENKDAKKSNAKFDQRYIETTMNPRVVLERLPLDSAFARSVLSTVPGLQDFEMIRPAIVDQIVNVVQVSGSRTASNVPVQTTQTSTQITPHIQRIGQPRSDKPELSETTASSTTATTTVTTSKPSTSQPSTLINILSQQIIRPGQSNCVRSRPSPLINILSQQIIRPANTPVKTTEPPTGTFQKTSTNEQSVVNEVKTVTTTAKTVTAQPPTSQGTILQFICKSTLPKFQQAFGKTVYQNNTESGEATTTVVTENPAVPESNKKPPPKNSQVIQPIQGGVIYTRQIPTGPTISLIPPGRGQVFRIAATNSDQISLVKDTVIHSKMSALLAAALQGKQKSSDAQPDGETTSEDRVTVTRPSLVQNARIVKPVLQIPSNVIRTSPQSSNMSSTTLEQLREFDMVYKQIKERSSTSTPAEPNTSEPNETSQRISVTYLNQGQKFTQLSPVVVVSSYCNLQPAASPALSVTSQGSSSPCVTPAPTPSSTKVSSKSSKGKTVKNTTTQASKASPIPKPQQKPQEDEHTTQRIFDILAEYAEQLRNSPDLNNKPAPRRRSNPPTNPSQNSKRKKSSGSKKGGQCSSMVSEADIEDHRTVGSEDSSCGVVQISMQEDEQNQIQSTKTESNDSSSGSRQQLILTEAGNNQTRNLIIADSSVGEALKIPNTAVLVPGNYIMPVSMVKGGQQIAVVSGGSKILATVPARSGPNMLLFQSFLNQNRGKSGVPTVKYSTIQPISGISSQTLAGVSGQPPVILPPNSHSLTAVTLGQPITLKKIEEPDRVNTELLLTISQPKDNGSASIENSAPIDVKDIKVEEVEAIKSEPSEVFQGYHKTNTTAIATPVITAQTVIKEEESEAVQTSDRNSAALIAPEIKNEATKPLERVQSVLVTACTSNGPMLSHTPPRYRKASESTGGNSEPAVKEEFLHNGEKQQNNNEQKHFQGNATYYQSKKKTAGSNPPRLDRELHQLCLQRKQAALERELRLQKSLSEECEDLGVDEPSTSDLFPEADILFDANHSPSFDHSSNQEPVKRANVEVKEDGNKGMTLFSDDENSSSMRTDFLFEPVGGYQSGGNELEYGHEPNRQLTNGQNSSASNTSGSSCEDNTLLQNCTSMSEVTLHSPVSPEYHDNTPPSLNKYKFKYSNRRKGGDRHKQEGWVAVGGEVSSSEDTTGSTELGKSSSHSMESCTNKTGGHGVSGGGLGGGGGGVGGGGVEEELSDGSFKVVRIEISNSDLFKDDESCEESHCDDDLDCSLTSGRGVRRSVKKMCSCCNGSPQDGGTSRKRPTSRPHTPAPHKKAFLNKKR